MITPTRRRFLLGGASLLAAPAIVRVASIMPVKAFVASPEDPDFVMVSVHQPGSPGSFGLAPLKGEGMDVAFDGSWNMMKPSSRERIWRGDLVTWGADNLVHPVKVGDHIRGCAVTDSMPLSERRWRAT